MECPLLSPPATYGPPGRSRSEGEARHARARYRASSGCLASASDLTRGPQGVRATLSAPDPEICAASDRVRAPLARMKRPVVSRGDDAVERAPSSGARRSMMASLQRPTLSYIPLTASAVAASAGKKASIANSDRVTSTGVPNTVVVKRNERFRPASRAAGHDDAAIRVAGGLCGPRSGIGPQLVHQLHEDRIGGEVDLPVQARDEVRAPFGEVDDARADPARMKAQPQHVDGRLEEARLGAGEQGGTAALAETSVQWRSTAMAG